MYKLYSSGELKMLALHCMTTVLSEITLEQIYRSITLYDYSVVRDNIGTKHCMTTVLSEITLEQIYRSITLYDYSVV